MYTTRHREVKEPGQESVAKCCTLASKMALASSLSQRGRRRLHLGGSPHRPPPPSSAAARLRAGRNPLAQGPERGRAFVRRGRRGRQANTYRGRWPQPNEVGVPCGLGPINVAIGSGGPGTAKTQRCLRRGGWAQRAAMSSGSERRPGAVSLSPARDVSREATERETRGALGASSE